MNNEPAPSAQPEVIHPTASPTDPSSYKTQQVVFTPADVLSAQKMAKWGVLLVFIPLTSFVGLAMCLIANSRLKKYNQNTATAKVGIVTGLLYTAISTVAVALMYLFLFVLKSYSNS